MTQYANDLFVLLGPCFGADVQDIARPPASHLASHRASLKRPLLKDETGLQRGSCLYRYILSRSQPFFLPNPSMANSQIPQLPQEILQIIINYLPGEDLKNVRLGGRTLALLAEPRLFQRMVLVPYIDCLEEFASMMSGNKIAHHVRFIHYDAESRWDPCWEKYYMPSPTVPDNRKVWWMISSANKLTHEHESTEISLLSNCFKELPSFRGLQVQDAEAYLNHVRRPMNSERSSYFARLESRLGRILWPSPLGARGRGSLIALLACVASESRIEKLELRNLQVNKWDTEIPGYETFGDLKQPIMYQCIFRQLRSITLSFYTGYLHCRFTGIHLGRILDPALELEHLTIEGIDEVTSPAIRCQDSWLRSILRGPDEEIRYETIFPRLKSLTLNRIVCHEPELVTLVRNHEGTLQSLCLANITLVKAEDDDSIPCLVRSLSAIRACKIPLVELFGRFTNRGTQWWWIDDTQNPCCEGDLKQSVEAWLTGENPETLKILESAAVRLNNEGKEVNASRGQRKYFDKSWKMGRVCSDLKMFPVDDWKHRERKKRKGGRYT